MILWWGSELLMKVSQAAIGGKTKIGGAIVDLSATAATAAVETTADAETTAVAKTTGKKEAMIEAVKLGQVRPGLNVMDDGIETEKLDLNREPTKTVMKPKTVLALRS